MESFKENKGERVDQASMNSSAPGSESLKKDNTGPITTATNRVDQSGFTHPQHDMSAPGSKRQEPDSAAGVTTATNITDDKGFTTPGEDMSKGRKDTK
ncbi:hypothetical protein ISF_00232 [Cordyceps fumosorosea ARSEF 2679]|uniref:Uncharacterized protein n=1 Tax=Cordyceps fumosorosea (strain ARSEF 2679) TaxID=1081104 RepID=A0A168E3G3_CORFA|nr:hypothetical protein ISF_00232 [Cordyceps fumosorosea ARSEF 2679]OAA73331.1 hypothetical protein ISF_00232 [Cordyceps fumosorosea ARSEF 2679]